MKSKEEYLLYKRWFLISLTLLLLNDFYFKYQFHNALTGKLSDFAGLFIFPYFLSIFLKDIKKVYFLTAIFFIFWKSEYSQSIINFINSFGFGVKRIVDFTDLIALSILPVSYLYRINNKIKAYRNPSISYCIILISCFSFIATTLPSQEEKINKKLNLQVEITKDINLVKKQMNLDTLKNSYKLRVWYPEKSTSIVFKVNIKKVGDNVCQIKVDSILNISTQGNLFTGLNEKDFGYMRRLKVLDFEKIILNEISKLQ